MRGGGGGSELGEGNKDIVQYLTNLHLTPPLFTFEKAYERLSLKKSLGKEV